VAAPRFFVSISCAAGMEVELEPDDAHHAAQVLRVRPGSLIALIDGRASWDAEITSVVKRRVHARITGPSAEAGGELPVTITVLQALTKGAKFDDVVEKCVELGAHRIVPVKCERSYAEATPARVDRWRRIAKSAAQQSRRKIAPTVAEPQTWRDALGQATVPILVAWEGAPRETLAAAMHQIGVSGPLSIAVGPEGSFTEEELEIARDAGCTFVSLGPTVLRTETAAAALLAAIASKFW
jgi:16S rRNA (uracil1498-N3)-methyltransferase